MVLVSSQLGTLRSQCSPCPEGVTVGVVIIPTQVDTGAISTLNTPFPPLCKHLIPVVGQLPSLAPFSHPPTPSTLTPGPHTNQAPPTDLWPWNQPIRDEHVGMIDSCQGKGEELLQNCWHCWKDAWNAWMMLFKYFYGRLRLTRTDGAAYNTTSFLNFASFASSKWNQSPKTHITSEIKLSSITSLWNF